ncbi:MAG: sigma-54-dependent Fis family transcriptional regulator, partial [Planctomycetes bacterium]|nr:sigma-54-dependent Fis family transcriptional regulator [Planctomycetota bacterium]
ELTAGIVYFDHIDRAPVEFQLAICDWASTLADAQAPSMRLAAGTTRNLQPLIEQDLFLKELFYQLSTIVIEIPPLRDRREDLEPLAQHFLEETNRSASRQSGGFDAEVWHAFRRYNWPGNVRELRQVVEEARATCPESTITAKFLPFPFRVGVDAQKVGPPIRRPIEPLDVVLERTERQQIELALSDSRRNKARAAEFLGINRTRLYRRMMQLGIEDLE